MRWYWISLIAFFAACTTQERNAADELLVQHEIHSSEGGEHGKLGDIVEFDLLQTLGDSVMANTFAIPAYRARVILDIPQFKGDYMEGISKLGAGDSASFWVPVDSIYQGELPNGITAGDKMRFVVKVHDVWNEDERIAELLANIERSREDSLDMVVLSSGLRIIWDARGEGPAIDFGDTVRIKAKGLFTNGSTFLNTEGKQPIDFVAGAGSVQPPAWDEAALYLRQGDMVTLIVPHSLGFGARDFPPILKYSTLIYELDVLKP